MPVSQGQKRDPPTFVFFTCRLFDTQRAHERAQEGTVALHGRRGNALTAVPAMIDGDRGGILHTAVDYRSAVFPRNNLSGSDS
jgi:hypothetical protein